MVHVYFSAHDPPKIPLSSVRPSRTRLCAACASVMATWRKIVQRISRRWSCSLCPQWHRTFSTCLTKSAISVLVSVNPWTYHWYCLRHKCGNISDCLCVIPIVAFDITVTGLLTGPNCYLLYTTFFISCQSKIIKPIKNQCTSNVDCCLQWTLHPTTWKWPSENASCKISRPLSGDSSLVKWNLNNYFEFLWWIRTCPWSHGGMTWIISAFILSPGARLQLFGSSKNGFGFRQSDLDICMVREGQDNIDVCHLIVIFQRCACKTVLLAEMEWEFHIMIVMTLIVTF